MLVGRLKKYIESCYNSKTFKVVIKYDRSIISYDEFKNL